MAETIQSGPAASAEYVLRQLDALPTLPAVAVRLIGATSSDRGGATELARLIQGDQSIAARLLKAANSAAAGGGGGVKTLDRAVVMLGFNAVRVIALTIKVFECFSVEKRDEPHDGFDPQEFWHHALATACLARRIAAAAPALSVSPEEAHAAGLLHDVGKAALAAVFPKAYDRAARQANHARGDIADAERAVLGVDHTIAGRRLAERWKLPRGLVEAIWLHHIAGEALPSTISAARLIHVVQLADVLAREHRIGYSGNHVFYEPSRGIAARIGIRDDALEVLTRAALTEAADQAAMLGLRDATTERMYFKSLQRANEELGRVSDELLDQQRKSAAGGRYFRALCRLDQAAGGAGEFQHVVAGIARAAAVALQRRMLAFAIQDDGRTLGCCWSDASADSGAVARPAGPELLRWIDSAASAACGYVAPAPAPVAELLGERRLVEPRENPWFVPIARGGALLGGVVFASGEDESQRLAGESDELRSFAAALGMALAAARAVGAGRRLAEDLAETNRRLQSAQLQLLRTRTLSMIAEMASGAAHELNSPLTVISGRAQMLASRIDDPEMKRALAQIESKAHECSRIVSELMDFAQPRTLKLEWVDLPAMCAAVRDEFLAESDLPASSVALEAAEALPSIQADPAQLRLVLKELIGNARDALRERPGRLTINCRRQTSDEMIELTVRDTGIGMTPTVLQRAFDPFFSHHKAGRRRGLGLPRAHRIVEAHGGRIWLESRVDEGTTAHVLLPTSPAGDAIVA